MLGFLSPTRFHDYVFATGSESVASLHDQHEMSNDKGKEVAAEPKWREKLAMLDQQFGWDEEDVSDWSDTGDEDNQRAHREDWPLSSEHDSQDRFDASQSTSNTNGKRLAVQDLPDDFDDEEENWETEDEEEDEESNEDDIPPRHTLVGYLYHRFGPFLRWEDRCSCCEFLVDPREERKKRDRAYFAQVGVSGAAKDPCVLLWFRQADLPGTENADKPVLMVTTPEGDELYPHDLEDYPDPPAPSQGRRPLSSPKQKEYAVPYEEEDTPDF